MKKTVPLLIILFAMNMIVSAQDAKLIDRELFFGNPEISSGQLSPDGTYISFMKEYNGIMNIWLKKFDEPFEEAIPLTDSPRPLYGYFWTKDSKYIIYVKDKDGDENINVFALDPTAKAKKGGVPESRNLTPLEDVTAQINLVSKINPDVMYISLNDRDKAWHDLYKLTISTGELELMYENTDRITGFGFDWDEKLRLVYKTDEKGNTTMYRVNTDNSLTEIYKTSVTEQAYVAGWTKDNSKCYLITNKGDLDLATLYLFDPETQKTTFMESDPKKRVDIDGIYLNEITKEPNSTSYTDDKTVIYWKDKKWEKHYKYLKKQFPGREVDFQSYTKDQTKFLISVWGDAFPSETYYYDGKTKELILQYTPRPKLKEIQDQLVEMQPIRYKSSDGLEIPAYLSMPKNSKGKVPLVVLVHGGPKGPRDYWGYDSQAQFLANRGYAVLQPNFRSSGGYGKSFLNAGDLQWGKLMQDDITWGVKHLIDKGIVDKNKVAIMGGSYGGYATLAGLAYTPDVYACGVDIVGPSNLFTLLESVPAYWEAGRAFLYGMVGDPNTEEGKKLLQEASPLFSADKIDKPLLIVQGANDPRVKQAEADQIVIALRDKGKKVDYLLAEDEGHGFAKPLNKMAMYAEVEKFLSEVLGGNYQKDMPKDVQETLEKLRVDVAKVTYTPAEKKENSTSLPKINNQFKEGEVKYGITIDFNGQIIPMDMTRTTSKEGNVWSVKDVASTPMGTIEEEIQFDSDFNQIERKINQMGQVITFSQKDNQWTVNAMGNMIPVASEGLMILEGPGTEVLYAGLPLQEGYSLVFQSIDDTTMQSKQLELKYIGKEDVKGMSCQKIEVTNVANSIDKKVYWIDAKTKELIQMKAVIPAMNNAKMTMIKK